jgi:hypothetical protein
MTEFQEVPKEVLVSNPARIDRALIEEPKFHTGAIFDRPCMVIATDGKAWWINPEIRLAVAVRFQWPWDHQTTPAGQTVHTERTESPK